MDDTVKGYQFEMFKDETNQEEGTMDDTIKGLDEVIRMLVDIISEVADAEDIVDAISEINNGLEIARIRYEEVMGTYHVKH